MRQIFNKRAQALGVVNGIIYFALFLGIMIFVFGTLKSNIDDNDTQTFLGNIVSSLSGTTGVIGAVVVLGIVGLIFVVLPMFRKED